jgi:tRNA (uracil-5-)-methyltransferase
LTVVVVVVVMVMVRMIMIIEEFHVQLKKKTEELKTMVSRLGDLVVRRNPELAGWAEQQREKYDGLAFQLDEIRPSPVVDAYRNKCEFRVGKQAAYLM